MCGKWNPMLMAMADSKAIMSKAIMYSSWMLHRTFCKIWHMIYHIVPRLYTLCHLVTRILLCCPIILCILFSSLSNLKVICPWLLTLNTGLLSCQVRPVPIHGPWPSSSWQEVQRSTRCCEIVVQVQ